MIYWIFIDSLLLWINLYYSKIDKQIIKLYIFEGYNHFHS